MTTDEPQQGPSHDAAERYHPRVAVLEPHDAFDSMEEEVQQVADHMQGTMPAYIMTTDDDSADEDQTTMQSRKHQKAELFYNRKGYSKNRRV